MTYDTLDICQYTCLKAVFGLRNVLICHLLTSHFFYLVLWAKMRLIPHKVDTTSSGIRRSLKPNTTNNSAGLHVLLCTCVKSIKGSRVCVDACITHKDKKSLLLTTKKIRRTSSDGRGLPVGQECPSDQQQSKPRLPFPPRRPRRVRRRGLSCGRIDGSRGFYLCAIING